MTTLHDIRVLGPSRNPLTIHLPIATQLNSIQIKHVLLAEAQSRSLPGAHDESRDESHDESPYESHDDPCL